MSASELYSDCDGVMIPQQPRKASDTEIKIFEKGNGAECAGIQNISGNCNRTLVADRGIVPDGSNKT